MVVSNICYFHPYLGKWSNLTNNFQIGWNHRPDYYPIVPPGKDRWRAITTPIDFESWLRHPTKGWRSPSTDSLHLYKDSLLKVRCLYTNIYIYIYTYIYTFLEGLTYQFLLIIGKATIPYILFATFHPPTDGWWWSSQTVNFWWCCPVVVGLASQPTPLTYSLHLEIAVFNCRPYQGKPMVTPWS